MSVDTIAKQFAEDNRALVWKWIGVGVLFFTAIMVTFMLLFGALSTPKELLANLLRGLPEERRWILHLYNYGYAYFSAVLTLLVQFGIAIAGALAIIINYYDAYRTGDSKRDCVWDLLRCKTAWKFMCRASLDVVPVGLLVGFLQTVIYPVRMLGWSTWVTVPFILTAVVLCYFTLIESLCSANCTFMLMRGNVEYTQLKSYYKEAKGAELVSLIESWVPLTPLYFSMFLIVPIVKAAPRYIMNLVFTVRGVN